MAIDFGASLDKILGAYQAVSVARTERDIAKYQAAGEVQKAVLNAPQGYTPGESYATGNAVNPYVAGGSGASGSFAIPAPAIYGGLALVAAVMLYKAVKNSA